MSVPIWGPDSQRDDRWKGPVETKPVQSEMWELLRASVETGLDETGLAGALLVLEHASEAPCDTRSRFNSAV